MSTTSPDGRRWPDQAVSRTVDLDGDIVHYLDVAGSDADPGRTLLCLHGLGGSALNFGVVAPLLAARFRVLVPDLPAHGRSPVPPPTATSGILPRYVDVVDRFVREVADGRVVLLGHSLGGIVAALTAVERPATFDELVLLAPPVPGRTRRALDPRLMARLLMLRLPGVRQLVGRLRGSDPAAIVRQQLAGATPHLGRVPADAVAAAVAETAWRLADPGTAAADRAQWQAILATVHLLSRPREWRRRLAALPMPVLWLQGEDDLMVAPRDARALVDQMGDGPGWTFRTRPGVGHLPHLEDPDWTAAQILDWSGLTAAGLGSYEPPGGASGVIRRRVVVSGTVQGVFFRDGTREAARRHGVAGWVTNREDGTVEAVFEGVGAAVGSVIDWVRHGPPQAEVSDVEVIDERPEGLTGFAVR